MKRFEVHVITVNGNEFHHIVEAESAFAAEELIETMWFDRGTLILGMIVRERISI